MSHLTQPVILALIDMAKVLLLMLGLLWYVQHRRYPQERKVATWPAVVGLYIVEIIIGVAMVPSLLSLAKLIPGA